VYSFLQASQLTFDYSDFIADTFVEYSVFDSHACQEGANDITENNDYLLSRFRTDLSPVGNGNGFRSMKVTLNIDPETISSSIIYEDFTTQAIVYFCVRINVYNMDSTLSSALEVNFLETPVLLTVDLVGEFQINSGSLTNAQSAVQLAEQDSAVEAYLCDSDANVVEQGNIQTQGQSVRVCVRPTDETMAKGAFLRYIEEFTFIREDISQVAISPGTGGVAGSELTVVSCEPGATLCAFETLLGAEFFSSTGIVNGVGTAYLQFGQGDTRRMKVVSRSTQVNDQGSALSGTPTKFTFDLVVLPFKDDGASGAGDTLPLSIILTLGSIMSSFFFW
jgi:hypothetical protein